MGIVDPAWRNVGLFLLMAFFALVLGGCGTGPTPAAPAEKGGQAMAFELTSTAFSQGDPIPANGVERSAGRHAQFCPHQR